jgi:hypothetical protein
MYVDRAGLTLAYAPAPGVVLNSVVDLTMTLGFSRPAAMDGITQFSANCVIVAEKLALTICSLVSEFTREFARLNPPLDTPRSDGMLKFV